MFDAEPFPGPSKAADDLVDDEENSVFVADLPDDFPVLFGRGIGSESLLNGFSNKGRDLFRVFELDDPLDIPCTGDIATRDRLNGAGSGNSKGNRRRSSRGPGVP